jgi:hypothetical protein
MGIVTIMGLFTGLGIKEEFTGNSGLSNTGQHCSIHLPLIGFARDFMVF